MTSLEQNNQVDLLEGKLNPSKLKEFEEICYLRAFFKGKYNGFLMQSSLGKFLVRKSLCKDPVQRERSNRTEKLRDLAQKIALVSGTGLDQAYVLASREPEFQRKPPEVIYWEVRFQRQLAGLFTEVEDKNLDIRKFFADHQDRYEELRQKMNDQEQILYLPYVLFNEQYVYLRDRFLEILIEEDWCGLLEFFKNNYRSEVFKGVRLQGWINEYKDKMKISR